MNSVILIGFTQYAIKTHEQTLKNILGQEVVLKTLIVSQKIQRKENADIVVCTSPIFVGYAEKYVIGYKHILIVDYTLKKHSVEAIKTMSEEGFISVVGVGYRIAASRKKLLERIGIPGDRLKLWYEDIEEGELAHNVVIFDNASIPNPEMHKVITVNSRMLGVLSVVRLILLLGKLEILRSKEFEEYYHTVYTLFESHDSYDLYGENDSTGWNHPASRGTLSFTSEFKIAMCDNYIEMVTGFSNNMLVEKTIFEVFPFLKKHIIQNSIKEYGERIENYKGKDLIISIELFELHEAFIGYMRISDYLQEEKRQNKLRRQISRKSYQAKYNFKDIHGKSLELTNCKNIAMKAAGSDASTLIIGETGTGKELFAQAIHNASSRRDFPFVAINCGAIVESLLESELFGYERGAFTGARKEGKEGLFELAHNGTLFMDEIGDMPLGLQVKLLRVLQEKEIVRIGGKEIIPVNVRIIAATNKDLYKLIEEGMFRADLFYRINVLSIVVPPLRQRRPDIRDLIEHQISQKGYSFIISVAAMKQIMEYPFKGNVRELQNCVDYLDSLGLTCIEMDDLPHYMLHTQENERLPKVSYDRETYWKGLDEITKRNLLFVLKAIADINSFGIGAGRRTITNHLRCCPEIAISERAVRDIVRQLEEIGLICINQGRKGIQLMEAGKNIIREL